MKNKKEYRNADWLDIDSAIAQVLKEMGALEKIIQAKIRKVWPDIVGKYAAESTLEILYLKNKLYIKVDSPALRQDMHMGRNMIKDNIYKQIGVSVQEIIVY